MTGLHIRVAAPSDMPQLRAAFIELQETERRLHSGLLPGEDVADAYLEWMFGKAAGDGAVIVAEIDAVLAGFASGWIENEDALEDTPDSRRYGLVSDVCVLAPYRGRRIAAELIETLETRFRRARVKYVRIGALAANKPARTAYERAGFAPYEIVYEKLL
jgi:GNAT superfamily N-acetyltransferase